MTDQTEAPERVWLEYYPDEHFLHLDNSNEGFTLNGVQVVFKYIREDIAREEARREGMLREGTLFNALADTHNAIMDLLEVIDLADDHWEVTNAKDAADRAIAAMKPTRTAIRAEADATNDDARDR